MTTTSNTPPKVSLARAACAIASRIRSEASGSGQRTSDEAAREMRWSNESVGDSCADGVTVTLEDPLGDRIVIDAATEDVVEVKPWDG